jgi:hypothetical protein
MAAVIGLGHVGIYVRDLERMANEPAGLQLD